MRVAFLGLERGKPSVIEALFRQGHQLVTWEGPWSGACLEAADCVWRLPTLAKVLAGVDAVLTLGPDDLALHDLVMRQGLLDLMTTETVHVSLTPASVAAIRHLTDMHAAIRQLFVSAPLIRQAPGSVSIIVAGHDEAVRRSQPLLELIGCPVVVGSTPWHANLVSEGISRRRSGQPDSAAATDAMLREAGIPRELFEQAARNAPPADAWDGPVGTGVVSTPPDRPVPRTAVDLAGRA